MSSFHGIKDAEVKKQLQRPIDICLNLKFSKGKLVYNENLKSFMIYDKEVNYDQIVDETPTEYVDMFNRVELDETLDYPQRELEPSDGLLYYYGENEGKLQMEGESLVEKVQILICITMYNENRDALKGTLLGIQRNLRLFKQMGISSDQIVAVILQDGILKMHPVTKNPPLLAPLDFLKTLSLLHKNKDRQGVLQDN